ncbi:acid sphingomyelinase-like phosphodiesterase 3a [Clupea harengus]|uniref:Acid sphingomyelinase-like phosphodiesterase n=1 Tax=Clupea harengus TaxID=7950 RepID=A0A6P3VZ87_CLUHA|nr:acid sphingomyelinase-like phosphodiesterase 3a [Clupea harengus]
MHRRVLFCLACLPVYLLVVAVPTPKLQNDRNGNIGKFWHISDLHLDPTYHVTEDRTKVCLSSKGYPASDPGAFGDFMCDSPYQLILSAFQFMKHSFPQPDFMIWTGDSPPHVPAAELSTQQVIDVIANTTHTIREFFPTLPVYPAVGNHDYWPQDQLPTSTNEIYQALAKLWAGWLEPEALATLREGGFYSQLIRPQLRLVSLNTILYYGPNKVTENMTDPAGQLQWLQNTLEASRQNMEMVYIIAHVPVGYLPYARDTTAMREVYNERLVEMFRNYSDLISGQFYGHTHRDSIMVLLDHQGKPVNSVFVTPAVTPIKNAREPYSNNPAVRTYLYDPADYGVLDIWQYYLNLTEANREGSSEWKLEYTLTGAFELTDARPQSLLELALALAEPGSKAFHKYFKHFMVSYNDTITCEGDCKSTQTCSVMFLDRDSYSACVKKMGKKK